MRYLIKSQRDDCYFAGFDKSQGSPCFGKIQEAKIYPDKYDALKDLRNMEPSGQRIIAVTRVGKQKFGNEIRS